MRGFISVESQTLKLFVKRRAEFVY